MTHYYQFVDAISAAPTVLLDLSDNNPFRVGRGSSVSPPTMRRVTAQPAGQDGQIEVATSYEERTLTIPLEVIQVSAESQATAIQTLARILDRREGAWLKWQSEGMDKPRFFRTHRASFNTIDDVLAANPARSLTLILQADPFGCGLPETGSFTITNDPTTGTNKMLAAFPTVKGDVASPLVLSFPTPDGIHKTFVASRADFAGSAPTAPHYASLTAGTINSSPPAGWAVADASDSTMVAGSRRRLTKTSGTAMVTPTAAVVQQWASLPPGDYRVMVRTGAAPAGTEVLFFNRPPSTGSVLIYSEAVGKAVVSQTTTGKDWLDLGVVAMPGGAPVTDVAFGLSGATGPALWNVAVNMTASTGVVDLDAVVLVPVTRPNVVSRQGSAQFPSTYTSRTIMWDGLNHRRFAIGISSFTAGVSSVASASEVTGGNPVVVPGASNVLHFFTTTADPSSASRVSDDKTATTAITWTYYPQYLYDRPSST